MKPGDKVVARGPIINEAWDPSRQGTIRNIHDDGMIDIQWDRGGVNYRCYPEAFMVVEGSSRHPLDRIEAGDHASDYTPDVEYLDQSAGCPDSCSHAWHRQAHRG